MNYYLVNKTGDGTKQNPFRPELEGDISFVCSPLNNNQYLVGTVDPVPLVEIVDLESFCTLNGIPFSDVLKWFVGD
ncbi:hypothetical protein CN601_06815 [Bacillus sp. AFS017336]|nr:hypothetical protein CN601_06815 [Bacillus sp. AFS017336]